jgi:hypothetical protein
MEALQLERLVDDPEIRRAAAKSLKGFCLTYLPHHFPADGLVNLSNCSEKSGGDEQSEPLRSACRMQPFLVLKR